MPGGLGELLGFATRCHAGLFNGHVWALHVETCRQAGREGGLRSGKGRRTCAIWQHVRGAPRGGGRSPGCSLHTTLAHMPDTFGTTHTLYARG